MDGSGRLSLRNHKFLKINPNAIQQQQPPQTPPPSPKIADSTSNLNPDAQPFGVRLYPSPSVLASIKNPKNGLT